MLMLASLSTATGQLSYCGHEATVSILGHVQPFLTESKFGCKCSLLPKSTRPAIRCNKGPGVAAPARAQHFTWAIAVAVGC